MFVSLIIYVEHKYFQKVLSGWELEQSVDVRRRLFGFTLFIKYKPDQYPDPNLITRIWTRETETNHTTEAIETLETIKTTETTETIETTETPETPEITEITETTGTIEITAI